MDGGIISMSGCCFNNCSSEKFGGFFFFPFFDFYSIFLGVIFSNGISIISGCIFKDCVSEWFYDGSSLIYGGGAIMHNGTNLDVSECVFDRCVFL
jgi:hypothetical protein